MSSSACPAGAPAVTSLRPSRLATRVAGAAVGSPGTVIPASGAGPLLADRARAAEVVVLATGAADDRCNATRTRSESARGVVHRGSAGDRGTRAAAFPRTAPQKNSPEVTGPGS